MIFRCVPLLVIFRLRRKREISFYAVFGLILWQFHFNTVYYTYGLIGLIYRLNLMSCNSFCYGSNIGRGQQVVNPSYTAVSLIKTRNEKR